MKKKLELTVDDSKQLIALARTIRQRCDTAKELVDYVAIKGNEAAAESILAGEALIEAQNIVGPRAWAAWLSDRCKRVRQSEARRCMDAARRARAGG